MSLLCLFSFGKRKVRINTITVKQAYEGVTSGTHILVDVRRLEEWNETGRPKGSFGITLHDPAFVNKVSQLVEGNKDAAIAMSCQAGGRSLKGSNKLADVGFTNVSNVEGGFMEWEKQGLPIDEPPFDGA